MPAPDSFVDTNILVYAISTDPNEAAKTAIARSLLSTANWCWSAQVAAEFINATTSPRRPVRLSLLDAEQWIVIWLAFPLIAIDAAIVKDAIRLARQYQISYFDAQIIAAARNQGCGTLYTEDLNHGQVYDGVAVMNPFAKVTP
jgi:predicted nucleic acid-binding protein